jgi:hypothetical protein
VWTGQRSHNTWESVVCLHREIRSSSWFLYRSAISWRTCPLTPQATPFLACLSHRASISCRVITMHVIAKRTWRRSIPPLRTRPTVRHPLPPPAAHPQLAAVPPATPSPSPRTRPWLSAIDTRDTREPAALEDDRRRQGRSFRQGPCSGKSDLQPRCLRQKSPERVQPVRIKRRIAPYGSPSR